MVVDLLLFKSRLDDLVTHAFGGNVAFGDCVNKSFEHFLNARANKPAELVRAREERGYNG